MIKALVRSCLLLLICLMGLIAFLLTPTALRWGVNFIAFSLPGKTTVQKVSGVIVGPMTLENIHYEDKTQIITLKKIRVNWHPSALRQHQLYINSLRVEGLHITSKQTAETETWDLKKLKTDLEKWLKQLENQHNHFTLLINHADLKDIVFASTQDQKNSFSFSSITFHTLNTHDTFNSAIAIKIQRPTPLEFTFALMGPAQDYHLSAVLKGNHSDFALFGNGNEKTLSLDTQKNILLNGQATLHYQILFNHSSTWKGLLTLHHLNPSLLNPEWLSQLSITAKTSGETLPVLKTKNDILVETDKGVLHLAISNDPQWKIAWEMRTSALARWFEVVAGELHSQGHITGDIDNPSFYAEINTNFRTDTIKLNDATITAEGDLMHHEIRLKANAPNQSIRLKIDGRYQDHVWHGLLNKVDMMLLRDTRWYLAKNANITLSPHKTTLDSLCLDSTKAGKICLSAGEWSPEKISGQLAVHLLHFGWLQTFLPTLHIAAGKADIALTLSGTPAKPIIVGNIHFPGARFVFTKLNITLDQLMGKITSDRQKVLIEAQAVSNKTPVTLKGVVDLTKPTLIAEGTLTTNNLCFINTEEYVAYATSQITATVNGQNIVIAGNITIPKATIHPNDYKPTVSLPDHDIVFVGGVAPPPQPYWNLQNNVSITLGKDVNIDVSGITAKLAGNIQVLQPLPNQAPIANGEIFIKEGIYHVYGQTLNIASDSYLEFSRSLLQNPNLNVRATKTIQSVENMGISNFSRTTLLVGIEITGTVKTPKITFFSNRPSLSEADILSYILLGYANTSNTPGNTDFLLRALAAVDVTSEGLMGKQNIASQIQRGLGLNEMGVESETTTDALGNPLNKQSAFVVGKSLTRQFYVRYSVGLLDQVNVFQLRYLLNQNWALQTDSSTLGNGADVLYTIEKN